LLAHSTGLSSGGSVCLGMGIAVKRKRFLVEQIAGILK